MNDDPGLVVTRGGIMLPTGNSDAFLGDVSQEVADKDPKPQNPKTPKN
jgi:hypothetical protein